MTDTSPSGAEVASRVAAALLGGYGFVWGVVSLGIVLGVAAGLPYEEAQTLMFLAAFLLLLAAFCWAFAARSVARVWTVLAGGGVSMTGAAWLAQRALL